MGLGGRTRLLNYHRMLGEPAGAHGKQLAQRAALGSPHFTALCLGEKAKNAS